MPLRTLELLFISVSTERYWWISHPQKKILQRRQLAERFEAWCHRSHCAAVSPHTLSLTLSLSKLCFSLDNLHPLWQSVHISLLSPLLLLLLSQILSPPYVALQHQRLKRYLWLPRLLHSLSHSSAFWRLLLSFPLSLALQLQENTLFTRVLLTDVPKTTQIWQQPPSFWASFFSKNKNAVRVSTDDDSMTFKNTLKQERLEFKGEDFMVERIHTGWEFPSFKPLYSMNHMKISFSFGFVPLKNPEWASVRLLTVKLGLTKKCKRRRKG